MASATPAADIPGQSTELTKERGVGGLRPSFWGAESSRRGERSWRSWNLKNQIILSARVMMVTGTGDKVVYHPGRSKGRSGTPTSCGGPIHCRLGDRSRRCDLRRSRYIGLARPYLQQPLNVTAMNVVRVIAWLWGEPIDERRLKPGTLPSSRHISWHTR
jgi:hypothetical protein